MLATTLTLSVTALAIWFGGPAGLLYLALFALTALPGLPVGWRLFGRAHPAGWVAGALVGYGLTTLAFWLPIRLGAAHLVSFVTVWLAVTAGCWIWCRHARQPLVILPSWGRRDAVAWLLVLHLVPVLLALPLGNVGVRDSTGARSYRAYFTADFFWHLTVLNEIKQFEPQPRNPFVASEPLHYYWTYFVVPAVVSSPTTDDVRPAVAALKVNALVAALLLLSMVYLPAWYVTRNGWSAAAAATLVLTAPSWEGLYVLRDLARTGQSLDVVRDLNIDAITAWTFHGLRIDNLVRTMWYTPQHGLSMALGLVAVLAALAGSPLTIMGSLLSGIALGLSTTLNPFLGGIFCLVYGVQALVWVAARGVSPRALLGLATAALPAMAGLGWCVLNRMSGPDGSHITFGPVPGTEHWGISLALSFGGLAAVLPAGLWPWRDSEWRPVIPAVVALGIGLTLMHYVSLDDRSWVGFRAGNLLLATLPMLAARGLDRLWSRAGSRVTALAFVACLASGLPTTAIDAYNAQDVSNLREGPGFPWTIVHTSAQQSGFRWIREHTSPASVVQADPVVRDRKNWCVIPAFAGRRMAAGLPISLLPAEHYEPAARRVHELLSTSAADEAHAGLRAFGVDYLWFDQDDGSAGAAAVARLAARTDLFALVFRRREVAILRVN